MTLTTIVRKLNFLQLSGFYCASVLI